MRSRDYSNANANANDYTNANANANDYANANANANDYSMNPWKPHSKNLWKIVFHKDRFSMFFKYNFKR
jgi:hypothetical protein